MMTFFERGKKMELSDHVEGGIGVKVREVISEEVTTREINLDMNLIQRMLLKGLEIKITDYTVKEIKFVKGDLPSFFRPYLPDELAILCKQEEGPSRIIQIPYHRVSIEYSDVEEPSMLLGEGRIIFNTLGRAVLEFDWAGNIEEVIYYAKLSVPHDYKGVLGPAVSCRRQSS